MTRFNLRAHHRLRAETAYLLFDILGGEEDVVAAWDIRHPSITVSLGDTLDDPLHLPHARAHYEFHVEGWARGLYVARPTWMTDDPALDQPPPQELMP